MNYEKIKHFKTKSLMSLTLLTYNSQLDEAMGLLQEPDLLL